MKSEIEVGGVTHAEQGGVDDRSFVVSQMEKSAHEEVLAYVTNAVTSVKCPLPSRVGMLQ